MRQVIHSTISPAQTTTEYYDPPLPDLDGMLPLSAMLVALQSPDGRVIRIFDFRNCVEYFEHLGYVRVASESEVTL